MITTYTFGKNNNNKFFHSFNKPNYSKVIDNIITADIISKNTYLFDNTDMDYIDDLLINAKTTNKFESDFDKAVKFLANYKKRKKNYIFPFKLNTMYTLSDGTPIIFFDDEIQIGSDFYSYTKFGNLSFINSLTPSKKKIIIDIYTFGNTNININIL